MKTLLLIIACLLSMNAMGQNGTLKLDSVKWSQSGFFKVDSTYQLRRTLSEPSYHFQTSNKPVMRISDLKPDSSFHVWIDKKSITWTSDSTFILKRKH